MSVLESWIEKRAIAIAESQWLLCIKLNLRGHRGWPDRLFIDLKGRHLYVEFKRKPERPRKIQIHRLRELRARNVHAYWTDNLDDFKLILDYFKTELAPPRIPIGGDENFVETSLSGAFLRSRAWENIDLPSDFQNPKGEGVR